MEWRGKFLLLQVQPSGGKQVRAWGKPNITQAAQSSLLLDADGSAFLFEGGINFPGIYSYESFHVPFPGVLHAGRPAIVWTVNILINNSLPTTGCLQREEVKISLCLELPLPVYSYPR